MDQKFLTKRIEEQRAYLEQIRRSLNFGKISLERHNELASGAQHQLNVYTNAIDIFEPQNFMDATLEFANKTFNNPSIESNAAHLKREAGELYDAIISNSDQQGKKMEVADCFILLLQVCSRLGMSFEDLMHVSVQKFEINKKRVWSEPDAEGVPHHLE